MMHNVDGLGYETAVASDLFAGKPESYVQVATMMSRMWASFIVIWTRIILEVSDVS